MKQHTISIIGGSGFVGHHLAARLVQDGHRVRVLSRCWCCPRSSSSNATCTTRRP